MCIRDRAWLLRAVAQRDMELSCDEAVLAGQDKAGRCLLYTSRCV